MTGKKGSDFEENLEQLEKIITGLEDGTFSLDKSLEEFEKGVKLYKNCKQELDKAEKKITKLTESLKEEALE